MARLRVPASPAKARPTTSAYAAFSYQTNNRPYNNPRSADPIYLDHGEHASETPLPLRPSIRSPVKGSVKSLTTMSQATKSDVQGYIVGQYKAVEKVGHEHIERTGTKTVFFLGREENKDEEVEHLDEDMKSDLGAYINEGKDEDRLWNGVRDFMRRDASRKTGSSARTREPSLAQCIASAGVNDDESDHDSCSEDDEIDFSQKIEHAISSFARKIEGYEDEQEDSTPMLPTKNYIVSRSPLLLRHEAIDISYPRRCEDHLGLRRHSGGRSLAFLIARAGKVSPSPDDDGSWSSQSPSVSPSPSSSSSLSLNIDSGSLSADDAPGILRERFRTVHYACGSTGCYRREWLNAKFELCCNMVHGLSLLRFATNCYKDEELEQSKDADIITHANLREVRVRTSPSKDTLKTRSSVRASLFSKLTSQTSMSSYRNSHWQCAQIEDEQRILSLPTLTTKDCHGELLVGEITQPCGLIPASARDSGEMSRVVMAEYACDAQIERVEPVEFYDDVSTNSEHDSEFSPATFSIPKRSCGKWTDRMKNCFFKIPRKTKQAAHDCVKATKHFSRTAWTFVPTALSNRHPFQKIDTMI